MELHSQRFDGVSVMTTFLSSSQVIPQLFAFLSQLINGYMGLLMVSCFASRVSGTGAILVCKVGIDSLA